MIIIKINCTREALSNVLLVVSSKPSAVCVVSCYYGANYCAQFADERRRKQPQCARTRTDFSIMSRAAARACAQVEKRLGCGSHSSTRQTILVSKRSL